VCESVNFKELEDKQCLLLLPLPLDASSEGCGDCDDEPFFLLLPTHDTIGFGDSEVKQCYRLLLPANSSFSA